MVHKGLYPEDIITTKKVRNQILKNGYSVQRHGITLYYDNDVYKKGDIIKMIGFNLIVNRTYYNNELKKFVYVCLYA